MLRIIYISQGEKHTKNSFYFSYLQNSYYIHIIEYDPILIFI